MSLRTIRSLGPTPRYIPEGSTEIRMPGVDAVAFCYSQNSKLYGICYIGKSSKSAWHFRFITPDARAARINETFANVKARADRKAKEAAERKAFTHTLKVGDVLVYSWGYEQTNIDYFQVTAVPSSKSIKVRSIGGKMVESKGYSSMAGQCVPVPNSFGEGEEILKRVSLGNYVPMKHGSAHLWDGRANYVSWYA